MRRWLACLIFCASIVWGATIPVPAGGRFQQALDAAQPGDVIRLEAGATYLGPFHLPAKEGSDWITIRTSASDQALPPGTRVSPAQSGAMPKLSTRTGSVVASDDAAHHYRFIGVEFLPAPGTFLYNLVLLGDGKQTSVDSLPHDIVFERCYMHGDPKKGARRAVGMNGSNISVIDSYLSNFKEVGNDSQALMAWNGPGPFRIVNNYLEAAGENVLFGGMDPAIPGLVPSDIEVRRNHFYKPLAWKVGDPSYEGTHWTVKNLFELKNARRVRVDGNVFEQNWADAQSGFAILFTPRNQDGASPWSVVEDVQFVNNIVRHVSAGINIMGRDNNHPSEQTRRILIRNNLLDDVGGERWGNNGQLFQLLDGTAGVVIDHNTGWQTGNIIAVQGAAHTGFQYTNNITLHNGYGIAGAATPPGRQSIQKYFPDAKVCGNIVVGGRGYDYPSKNYLVASIEALGLLDAANRNFRLGDGSPYKNKGTDGKDVGVDMDALAAAIAGAAGS